MAAAVACFLVVALAAVAGSVDGTTSTSTSPAPAPAAVVCQSEALKLADCLDYVTPGNAAPRPPSKTCCAEVKSALKDSVAVGCLCAAFSSKDLPIPINVTRAFHLPAACGADSAAFSKCLAPSPSQSMAPGTPSSGSGGAAAAARSPVASTTALLVVAAVAAPVLAFFHL